MPRAPKSCGHPGCPEYVTGSTYCEPHQREHRNKARRSPTSRAADKRAERTRRVLTVRAWVAVNGWVCPGWRRAPHESHDLTAAHMVAVAHGGTHGPLSVLCRGCNSRQRTESTHPGGPPPTT